MNLHKCNTLDSSYRFNSRN